VNCVYEAPEIANVTCDGMFERVAFDDAEEIACKMKCTDKQPGASETPEPVLAEEPEPAEVNAKEPDFPDGKWWLGWDESTGNSENVIAFANGSDFTLEGPLADEWGIAAGTCSGSNTADPKTITLNWEGGVPPQP